SGALLWGAGAQESWMVLGSLASLAAFLARRSWLAAALLVPALLSKETAAVVPLIALVLPLIERDPWSTALPRVAPLALVTVAWALLHPPLVRHDAVAGSAAAFATGGLRTLLSFANLQRVPHPDKGWPDALLAALPALLVLAAAGAWTARSSAAPTSTPL